MRLFIVGFPFDVDDQELKELFEEFGEVLSAKVVTDKETGKSRGFGFVEMPDAAAAQVAITELSNSEYGGRRLTVKQAEERERNDPRGKVSHRRPQNNNNRKKQ